MNELQPPNASPEQRLAASKENSYNSESHSKSSVSSGGSPGIAGTRRSPQDLVNTRPPNFTSRIKRMLFQQGVIPKRPGYLQEVYDNIPRTIYFNYDLPNDMKDPQGHPIIQYPRNKIRTTKYTPLSFLPKNIVFQFTNIANFYFLVLVILGAFQIFGVPSPGLAAVPLIVIVTITAVKDALEDYRRAVSDSELNNSPIHLLSGTVNPNVLTTDIGPWRRFKKACTRGTFATFRAFKKCGVFICGSKTKKQEFIRQQVQEEEYALHRVSTVNSEYSYQSQPEPRLSIESPIHNNLRKSMQSGRSRHRPTVALPNSLLNPVVKQANSNLDDSSRPSFKNRRWKDVNVGDLIRIRANEEVPADVIILSTSDQEGNCYVETKNLDGETNLKMKTVLKCGGTNNLKHSDDLGDTKFWVECDAPNPSLYTFRGTIHYENYDSQGTLVNPDEKEPITTDNVLLRGCTLRNTKWVIGLVVYTGPESKIMLNSGITPTKKSRISKELNLSVIINFLFLFILCFISGLVNGLFYRETDNSRVFFEIKPYGSTPAINGVLAFFVTLIIYQALVPISLYISVEIVKTLQAFFIYSDLKMYYDRLDFPCIPKSWNISDDLGQIEYIFSDKTGTLTQNVMEFKKCTVAGKSYGLAYTEAKQGLDKRNGLDIVTELNKWKRKIAEDKQDMIENLVKYSSNDQLREEDVTFASSEYVKDTMMEDSTRKEVNERFMTALALCHTVVTEVSETDPGLRNFKAESPDESALVSVARDLGIVFKERLRKSVVIDKYGEELTYELLDIIPFTSARKRMSCILKTPDDRIILYTKGADNVIFQRLDPEHNSNDVISKTALHLEDYATEGLRTLCITEKEIDYEYYKSWSVRYGEANACIDDDRDELISRVEDEIECNLVLLGGTAIEDRLQPGVPSSIAILAQAGIKLWVLTGDRIETAINIGFSCNLLENDMRLLVVRPEENDLENVDYVDGLVTGYLKEHFDVDTSDPNTIPGLIAAAKLDHSAPNPNFAVIIDGAALQLVFQDLSEHKDESVRTLRDKFLLLGKQCKSVICCRVSPSQKAEMVKLVKDSLQVMTLAIGDGANDVAMIQAANVGVGIAGEEGRQAVMSSDYAIGQFRYLTRLLLVHGRWSYKRLAEMIPCFFYKNVVFTVTCFWFGIFNNFDGSYLYEYTFLIFYNLAFTSLPVIVLAVLDQDVSDTISLLTPQLYRSGILGLEWSQYKFAWYMLDGLYQSVISFFFPYLLYVVSFQNPQGLTIDHRFWIGVVVISIAVTACNIYVLLQQKRWDWLTLLIDGISIILVYFWTGAWSANLFAAEEFFRAGAQILGTLAVWCCIFVGVLACLIPRFIYDFLLRNFRPKDIDIIRERSRMGEYDDYPQGFDPTNEEDVERHRLLTEIIDKDPTMLDQIQPSRQESHEDLESTGANPLTRTFNTIKKRATIQTRSRKNTAARSRKNTINDQFHKPIDINLLRQQMIQSGEYQTARTSLERINTTHQLPGLTQAETLITYHTRNSMSLNR
ncbi:Phospholipid-transporting ATPase DNF1 [Spathaspora sp. JA1]|nr:Phospholipid-transporting ATPase DNF1 [Spathaspora sp. JA1]